MAKATAKRLSKEWPLDKIREYSHNPRTHPPAQIELLAELFKKYGPDQDIVVDEKGIIIKGHGRKLAAIKAGRKTYPVTQWTGLSEEDKSALRISDNQVGLLSGWDTELVRFEIERLKRADYPIELLGFGEAQLVQFQTQPGPPAGGFQSFDAETIPTEHQCPKCGYKWSGKSSPPPPEEKPERKPRAAAAKKKAAKK